MIYHLVARLPHVVQYVFVFAIIESHCDSEDLYYISHTYANIHLFIQIVHVSDFFPLFSPIWKPIVSYLLYIPLLLLIHCNGPVARWPGSYKTLESDCAFSKPHHLSGFRDRSPETSVSRALLYTAIQQPPQSAPPPPPPREWRAN